MALSETTFQKMDLVDFGDFGQSEMESTVARISKMQNVQLEKQNQTTRNSDFQKAEFKVDALENSDSQFVEEDTLTFLQNNIKNIKNISVERNNVLSQKFENVKLENSTIHFSPRKSKTSLSTKYEDAATTDVRKLLKLVENENDENLENFGKNICEKHEKSNIVNAVVKISSDFSRNSNFSENSTGAWVDFEKTWVENMEKEFDEFRQKDSEIEKKINLTILKSDQSQRVRDWKIRNMAEKHDRKNVDIIEDIVKKTKTKECLEFLTKRCQKKAKCAKVGKTSKENQKEIRNLRLQRETHVLNSFEVDQGTFSEDVGKRLSDMDETVGRCQNDQTCLADSQNQELDKVKEIDQLRKTFDVNKYGEEMGKLIEDVTGHSAISLEGMFEMLHPKQIKNKINSINVDDDVECFGLAAQQVADQKLLVGAFNSFFQNVDFETETEINEAKSKLKTAKSNMKRKDIMNVMDNVFLTHDSKFKKAYEKFAQPK